MEQLNTRKEEIENLLEKLKKEREEKARLLDEINSQIKEKICLHNNLVSSLGGLKKDYKEKLHKYNTLKAMVKEYKKAQREVIQKEYAKEIKRLLAKINETPFEMKLSAFKSFDSLMAMQTEKFPILHRKKEDLFNDQRVILKKKLFREVKRGIGSDSAITDFVFYVNFIIKYEIYFKEEAMIPFFSKIVEKEFEYHFLSNRESNRLDKPEWFFDFLLKKYETLDPSIEIYSDCRAEHGLQPKSVIELIHASKKLIITKLNEIAKTSGPQKRNLVLHFVTKFSEFSQKIKEIYSIDFFVDEIGHVLFTTQSEYVKTELTRTHKLKYIQWFPEYKQICRDALLYISKYGDFDKEFRFKDVINSILSHTRTFVENLRFINREEVKAVCFLFSELEELKNYLTEQESELFIYSISANTIITASSIDKITFLNTEIFKLIKNLAINDTINALNRIVSFSYSTTEIRRTSIVEISKLIDEYKICIYSDLIEKAIQERADEMLFDEVLMKTRFTPNEYLEFRGFYKALKKVFSEHKWKSDDACKCIDAIFEDNIIESDLYKQLKKVYS